MVVVRSVFVLVVLASVACAPRGDASPEADTPFTRLAPGWEHCAEPARPRPTEGTLWIQNTAAATYCVAARTDVGPHEVIDNKAMIHLGADDLFLPLDDGEHEVFVSVCGRARFADAAEILLVGPAKWTVSRTTVLGQSTIEGVLLQRLDDGRAFEIKLRGPESAMAGYRDDAPGGILLDGSARSSELTPKITMRLCETEACEEARQVASCPSDQPQAFDRASMTFVGGELELVSRYDPEADSFVGALLSAEGSLDGVAFALRPLEADAYWSLSQYSSNGNLYRSAAIRFETPINQTCGLWVPSYYPQDDFYFRMQRIQCEDDVTTRLQSILSRYDADVPAP